MVRDLAFISFLLMGPVLAWALFRKVSATARQARRMLGNAGEAVSVLSRSFFKPAASGSAAAFGLGKLGSLLMGQMRKKKEASGGPDGEE